MTSVPMRGESRGAGKGEAKAKPGRTMSLFEMLKVTVSDWSEDKAMKLSAALALYTILSLAPLMVISIKVIGKVMGSEAATGQVARQMEGLIGSAGAQAIQDMVANASKPGSGIESGELAGSVPKSASKHMSVCLSI